MVFLFNLVLNVYGVVGYDLPCMWRSCFLTSHVLRCIHVIANLCQPILLYNFVVILPNPELADDDETIQAKVKYKKSSATARCSCRLIKSNGDWIELDKILHCLEEKHNRIFLSLISC